MASKHDYEIIYVPGACTQYALGDIVPFLVSDPAPEYVTVSNTSACSGTIGQLAEEQEEARTIEGKATSPSQHTYRVRSVPADCSAFKVGEERKLTVPTPPPQSIAIVGSGHCDGTVLTLVK